MIQRFCRAAALIFTFVSLAIPLVSTSAQAATITVVPLWHPPVQLTSTVSDTRTARAELWVTSNVQFWAAQFTCTVNGTALHIAPLVTWNTGVWGAVSIDYTHAATQYTAGKITIVASELEPHAPVGTNGVVQTALLVTLYYQLPVDVTASTTSPLTCTAMFLDKNGHPIVTPTVKPPAPLQIVTGYPLKGNVTYQGRSSSAGITVTCNNPSANPATISTTTAANGSFSFPSVRGLGTYNCNYVSALGVELSATTSVNLSTQGFAIPPVVLKGGDVDQDLSINNSDLGLLAADFGNTGMGPGQGDITGDGKVDGADLGILAANYNTNAPSDSRHMLIGFSRNPSVLNNGRIWLWTLSANPVIAYGGAPTAKAYWPILSPDGSKVAYIQEVVPGTFDPVTGFVIKLPRYALFVGPAGGTTGTQITPNNWNYDAFAPAWSPDGSKIAFSCGTSNGNPATAQWTTGSGINGLCVIDTAGSNLSVLAPSTTFIQRPAWVSNSQIVTPDSGGNLVQYDLTYGLSATLANVTPSNQFVVFRDGKLFFLHTDVGGTVLHIIDYASGGILFNPEAVPPFVSFKTAPAVGYYTDVGDGSGTINFAGMCGFDVATGLDFVVDRCNGTYRRFYRSASAVPTWNEDMTPNSFIAMEGAVAPSGAGGDPYGIWLRVVGTSVNFVP